MGIVRHLKIIAVISIYNIINMFFLAFWVVAQWFLKKYVIDQHELFGVDLWTLWILQAVFVLATLTPVVAWIYLDTKAMVKLLVKMAEETSEGKHEELAA